MARKTTVNATPRSKKSVVPAQPVNLQGEDEGQRLGKALANMADNTNIEERIRVRAYELYLQRRATAGNANANGNPNQDWLIAEREILSRQNGPDHHSA